jgi:hypothetical protein
MDYQHDIFISYRRNPETLTWIKMHFVPLLELRVEMELERKPSIYLDSQVDSGASWPVSIGRALGTSRVMITLWTGNYLASVWCAEELAHMLAREEKCHLRTVERPHGLVVPAFIHDGDKFPIELSHIQHFEIQSSFNVRMAKDSPRAEDLDSALKDQAPAIAACIENAPAWQREWPKEAAAKFFERFYQRAKAQQTSLPRFTTK